jgi:two-component system cell cycle sensor histidine kinase/response regulator CckA
MTESKEAATHDKTILMVEDEELVRTVTQEVLEMEGYKVFAAANAAEALRLFEEHGYIDLLLTDVVLPGMNGKDLAVTMLRKVEGLRVMFMSGYADNMLLREGIEGVASCYLQKPFTLETLTERVREVLARPEPLEIVQALRTQAKPEWKDAH